MKAVADYLVMGNQCAVNREAPAAASVGAAVPATVVSIERHDSAGEIADIWGLNVETIRRVFDREPGVVVLQGPVKKGRRPYKTIRVPQTVLDRVHRRLQR
ncbi:MAG: hypothetical protein WDO73_10515 [Ignavibacteriota bacterium]